MAKNTTARKKRIAHNLTSFDNHEILPDDIVSKILEGMDSSIIPNDTFESNLFKSSKVPPRKEKTIQETQAVSRNCANIVKKFGTNRKHPLMEKTKITLKQLKHNRQIPKPRAHLAQLSVADKPLKTEKPKRTIKAKEVKQTETKTKKLNQESKIKNVPKKPELFQKLSCPMEESSDVERNNCNKIDDSSDSEYEKFIKKSKKGLKAKPKSSNLKRKKSPPPPPKKVCKKYTSKSAAVTKSILTESDSESDEMALSKLPYSKSKRTKKPHNISQNTRSRISDKDSESEMDVYDGETYHASTSENETFAGEPYCDDEFSDRMDAQNSLDKSDFAPLVDNGEFNCLRRTTDNTSTMKNDPVNILHKTPVCSSYTPFVNSDQTNVLQASDVALVNGNQTNVFQAPHVTPLVNNAKDNVLHRSRGIPFESSNKINVLQTSNVVTPVNGNQTNLFHMPHVTPLVDTKDNVLHRSPGIPFESNNQINVLQASDVTQVNSNQTNLFQTPHVTQSVKGVLHTPHVAPLVKTEGVLHTPHVASLVGNQSNISSNGNIDTIDLIDSDDESEKSLPKIVKVSGQNENSLSHSDDDSEIEMVDVIVHPLKPKCNVKKEKVDQISSCSNPNEKIDPIPSCNNTNTKVDPIPSCSNANKKVDQIPSCSNANKKVDQIPSCSNANKKVDQIPSCSNANKKVDQIPSCSNANKKVDQIPSCSNVNKKVDQIPSCSNTKQHSAVDLNNKYEAVFATNMCQKLSTEEPNVSINSILNKKIKTEPCKEDDVEILLDSALTFKPSNSIPNPPKPICKNIGIKTEKDSKISTTVNDASNNNSLADKKMSILSEKEQKLHEVACSNFKNLTEASNQKLEFLENKRTPSESDILSALKALKEEFQNYNEIIQMEQYIEDSFKELEKRQAKRLISIKSRISQLIASSSGTGDNINVNDYLAGAELGGSQALESCTQLSYPSCSSATTTIPTVPEDSKTSITLVPLSTISEQDIKPNLSDLQSALKQTAPAPEDSNNMSFGEKCIVCSKEALAACERCAKVFYCSNECGKKYWEMGHGNTCQ